MRLAISSADGIRVEGVRFTTPREVEEFLAAGGANKAYEAVDGVAAPEPVAAAQDWLTDFVNDLGRSRAEREPNASLRLLMQERPDVFSGRIIDLGCGEGRDSLYLLSQGHDVVSVDVSHSALSRARERATAA